MADMGWTRSLALGIGGAFAILSAMGVSQAALSREGSWAEQVGSGNFAARLLEAHNAERRRLDVPELRWSAKLAAEAQSYAQVLADRQALAHASRTERGGAGENLWAGRAGFYSAEEMVGSMIAERRDFTPGEFPKVSRTGQWRDVGHYTQLIWRETTEVGCAVAPGGGQDWLVCRYWPAGNVYGRPVL